jgi:hypothetical protein
MARYRKSAWHAREGSSPGGMTSKARAEGLDGGALRRPIHLPTQGTRRTAAARLMPAITRLPNSWALVGDPPERYSDHFCGHEPSVTAQTNDLIEK